MAIKIADDTLLEHPAPRIAVIASRPLDMNVGVAHALMEQLNLGPIPVRRDWGHGQTSIFRRPVLSPNHPVEEYLGGSICGLVCLLAAHFNNANTPDRNLVE